MAKTTEKDALVLAMKALDKLSDAKRKPMSPQDSAALQTAADIIEAVIKANGYQVHYGLKSPMTPKLRKLPPEPEVS